MYRSRYSTWLWKSGAGLEGQSAIDDYLPTVRLRLDGTPNSFRRNRSWSQTTESVTHYLKGTCYQFGANESFRAVKGPGEPSRPEEGVEGVCGQVEVSVTPTKVGGGVVPNLRSLILSEELGDTNHRVVATTTVLGGIGLNYATRYGFDKYVAVP